MILLNVHITGNLVNAFIICPRKAWLFAHQISPVDHSDLMEIGKLIAEETFKRERKEIMIGNIKIDLIKKGLDNILVGEIKKSSKGIDAAKLQLLYYLFRLKEYGIEATGLLLIPREKKRVEVKLTEEATQTLKKILKQLEVLIYQRNPPPPQKTQYCKNCSLHDFCWS